MSFFKRLRSFLRREKLDAELDDELRFHLDQRTQDFIDEGMTPREARYAARRAFGNVGSLKEETRDSWGFRLLETLWQDVRFGGADAGAKSRVYPGGRADAGVGDRGQHSDLQPY